MARTSLKTQIIFMPTIFANYQPINLISVNQENIYKLEHLIKVTSAQVWLSENLKQDSNHKPNYSQLNVYFYKDSLAQHLAEIWAESRSLIFCLTVGAVVRLIAPLLTNKKNDPAVIVIDPETKYVISLLGGHQAFTDKLTELIAHQLDATPIITSASHHQNLPAIDTFGYTYGWQKGEGNWNEISGLISRNQLILVQQETGLNWWQNRLTKQHTFIFATENNSQISHQGIVYIGVKSPTNFDYTLPYISWHPRVLWVGIGCERNTSSQLIKRAVEQVFNQYNLTSKAIACLTTINIKADEQGIINLAENWNLPLKTFSAEELDQINVPSPSIIVKQEVGTKSVAEASALKGASLNQLRETKFSEPQLIVPKQIIKSENEQGAVTVAIAQSALEYNDSQGKLYLVGIGPGNLDNLTSKAKTALRDADVIIGYRLYLDLISSLFHPEQIIESSQITQEKQRAKRAIKLAEWGLTVAVISSGDCGIYGMAGLVLEILANQNWNGKSPSVEVIAGITAMQAVAAKIGSPLMHDFCAISLSDLLIPPEVIETRLIAAAKADFVTSLYNPRSQKRTQQIIQAQSIFLQYRSATTPVAIAKSITREDEQITITTLAEMLNYPIDMLTTVIIGNSKTITHQNLLITPRGYLEFRI